MRFKLNESMWCLRADQGLLIGSGDRVQKLVRCNPRVFELVRTIEATLQSGPHGFEALADAQTAAVPTGVLQDVISRLLDCGFLLADLPSETQEPAGDATRATLVFCVDDAMRPHLERTLREHDAMHGVRANDTWIDLEDASIEDAVSADDLSLVVAAASSPLRRLRAFPQINRACVRASTPLLLAYCDASTSFAGPFVFPGETACYRCVELREQSHAAIPHHHQLIRANIENIAVTAAPETDRRCLADLALVLTSEIECFLTRERVPVTYKAILERDARRLSSVRHPVLRVPICDVCGNFRSKQRVTPWIV
ncbi:MAG: TOMM precursor leader peptide-binding protein [Acidobacteriota bacterium]